MMAATPMQKPPPSKTSGVVVPHSAKWYQRLAAALIFLLVRAVSATTRYQWLGVNDLPLAEQPRPAIFCIWHNRLALCLELYRLRVRNVGSLRRLAAMVSASKDGGLLASVLERNGVEPVRGSTSRRGRQALLELTTWAERGYDLAITPDGPRGPLYVVQDGVTSLAQLTGLPVIPVSYQTSWKIHLKSWDRFQIPLPFARCVVRFGEPLLVPREATDAQREELRRELERRLNAMTVD